MDLLTLLLIILVIAWAFGGLFLPTAGTLLNVLLLVVLVVLIVKVVRSV